LLENEFRQLVGTRRSVPPPQPHAATLIAMMQTSDFWEGNDLARRGKLYATRPRAVFMEREMRSGVMMILKIAREYAVQVTLAEDDNVIQTFAADRTDESLGVGILPG
jgi:hypothetical protein